MRGGAVKTTEIWSLIIVLQCFVTMFPMDGIVGSYSTTKFIDIVQFLIPCEQHLLKLILPLASGSEQLRMMQRATGYGVELVT